MASGELSTIERPRALPDANGHADHADHAALAPLDNGYADRSAELRHRPVSPFSPRQLSRLDEALTLSSRETGIEFSVYVGKLDEPTREHAERLHSGLPRPADGVLLAVSPEQRVLHIVTGEHSSRRLPDRACALAALSMRASLSVGDLIGALVNGLRMLSDQAGRVSERDAGTPLAPPHHGH
jgi:hypothetical protein